MLKMYRELADWWPLLSPVEDYAEEAAFFGDIISKTDLTTSNSLLELGCGGGSNAYYLKKLFDHITLTDLSPQMLEISRKLNPACEHLSGDMRRIRLGRIFDVIFIHDAIDYMLTPRDLEQTFKTAFVHCKPGGLALFVPDHVTETFAPSTDHGGSDGRDRSLRYLEWTYDPDKTDSRYTVEYAYLLREGDQPARVEQEQHICGLFPRTEWLHILQQVGFQPEIVHDKYDRDIFVAHKPNIQ